MQACVCECINKYIYIHKLRSRAARKSILKKIQDGIINLDENPLNNIVNQFVEEEEKIEVSKNYCSNC